MVDRLLILLVPLLVILIPLFRMAPRIYQWRMRSRVYRWYKRLRALDARSLLPLSAEERATNLAAAEQLEEDITNAVRVPLGYMESFYTLRTHLAYVRHRLASGGKPD